MKSINIYNNLIRIANIIRDSFEEIKGAKIDIGNEYFMVKSLSGLYTISKFSNEGGFPKVEVFKDVFEFQKRIIDISKLTYDREYLIESQGLKKRIERMHKIDLGLIDPYNEKEKKEKKQRLEKYLSDLNVKSAVNAS